MADRLIGSFLDQVRAGELPLDQHADLAAIARSVAAEAGRGGTAPAVDAPQSLMLAHSHPLLLERLLANLVDNACKARPARRWRWRCAPGRWRAHRVSDAGPGLPDERREALTEPSRAATRRAARRAPGWAWRSSRASSRAWAAGSPSSGVTGVTWPASRCPHPEGAPSRSPQRARCRRGGRRIIAPFHPNRAAERHGLVEQSPDHRQPRPRPRGALHPNGNAVCNVSVATTRQWKNKDSGERQEETEWHRVVFYDRLAEIAGEYLKKGRSVYVEGRLKTRKVAGQGKARTSTPPE